MRTLCIDTAYKYLTLCLIEDNKIRFAYSAECFKKQSEQIFVILQHLFEENQMNPKEIEAICISKGPGSYTGVRIGMTIGKTLAHLNSLPLYTISTLRLYAANCEKTMVIMDARANRAYVGVYDQDRCLLPDQAIELSQIDSKDYRVVLDGSLIGKEDVTVNIPEAFLRTAASWEPVKDVAYLTPEYLKDSDAYYR